MVTSIVDVLEASFQRLDDLQQYGNEFLQRAAAQAEQVRADAGQARQRAITVMLVAFGVSLLLLALVLVSILRPLRRLTRQSPARWATATSCSPR